MTDEVSAIRDYLDRLRAFLNTSHFETVTTGAERPWQEVHASIDCSICMMLLLFVNSLSELSALERIKLTARLEALEEQYPWLSLQAVTVDA